MSQLFYLYWSHNNIWRFSQVTNLIWILSLLRIFIRNLLQLFRMLPRAIWLCWTLPVSPVSLWQRWQVWLQKNAFRYQIRKPHLGYLWDRTFTEHGKIYFSFVAVTLKIVLKKFFLRSNHHVSLKLLNLNHLVIRCEQSWHNIAAWLNNLKFFSPYRKTTNAQHNFILSHLMCSYFQVSFQTPLLNRNCSFPSPFSPIPITSHGAIICCEIVSGPVLVFIA